VIQRERSWLGCTSFRAGVRGDSRLVSRLGHNSGGYEVCTEVSMKVRGVWSSSVTER
jgi:hypothetical protein